MAKSSSLWNEKLTPLDSGKADNEIGVVFIAPRAALEQNAEAFDAAREAASQSKITLVEVGVDAIEQTLEQAIFHISTEVRPEPDLFLVTDQKSEDFDPSELARRITYHFPKSRIALIVPRGETVDIDLFDEFPSVHFALDFSRIPGLFSTVSHLEGEPAFDSFPDDIVVNRPLVESADKLSEVTMTYTMKTVEDEEFKDVWLNTPVAPKTLPANETVAEILSRERTVGRVLLVIPSQFNVYGTKIVPAYPWIGILSIAAMLEHAGHYVEIIDMDADHLSMESVLDHMIAGEFQILGLTATTPTYPNAVELARETKKRKSDITTILGGIHATIDWAECVRETAFDFVAIGEAECTTVELVDAIMAGTNSFSEIKGIVYLGADEHIISNGARSLEPDLDSYPFPAHHLIGRWNKYLPPDTEYHPAAAIMVSRGCPGQCTYCETKNIFGRQTRFRSPENVIAEIRGLVNDYGIKEIHFLDDVITANKTFIREFCRLLVAEPYRLRLQVPNGLRADMVNRETLELLKSAGLRNVGFGIESGNERVLKLIKKGISKDRVRKAVSLAKELDLQTWGFFMMGMPGDNEVSIRETIEFAIELDVKFAKFLILKPFPGSEVYYQLDERGLVDSRDFGTYGVYMPPVHHLDDLSADRILELQRYAFRRFYFRPSKIWDHVSDIRSLAKLGSFLRGILFIAAQSLNRRVVGWGLNTGG